MTTSCKDLEVFDFTEEGVDEFAGRFKSKPENPNALVKYTVPPPQAAATTKQKGRITKQKVRITKRKGRITKQKAYRCSMQFLREQVRSLKFTSNQLKALEKTPFWHMIDILRSGEVLDKQCVKKDGIINCIVNCYVKGKKCFRFGKREMKLNPIDAKLIFGINDGEKEINISFWQFERTDFLQRCFPEKISKTSKNIRLRPKLICDKIKEMIGSPHQEDVNCVASLTTLLVLASLLVTTKTSYIPWAYTTLVSDLDTISNYNWSKHVVDLLLDSLESTKNGWVERCVLLLTYWLCERTQILIPIHETSIPRFVKWDLSALYKTLNASNFAAIVNNQNFNVMKATRKENEELLGRTRNELELLCEATEYETEEALILDEMNLIEVPITTSRTSFRKAPKGSKRSGVIARMKEECVAQLNKRLKVESGQQTRRSQRNMNNMWKGKCKETNGMAIEID